MLRREAKVIHVNVRKLKHQSISNRKHFKQRYEVQSSVTLEHMKRGLLKCKIESVPVERSLIL